MARRVSRAARGPLAAGLFAGADAPGGTAVAAGATDDDAATRIGARLMQQLWRAGERAVAAAGGRCTGGCTNSGGESREAHAADSGDGSYAVSATHWAGENREARVPNSESGSCAVISTMVRRAAARVAARIAGARAATGVWRIARAASGHRARRALRFGRSRSGSSRSRAIAPARRQLRPTPSSAAGPRGASRARALGLRAADGACCTATFITSTSCAAIATGGWRSTQGHAG